MRGDQHSEKPTLRRMKYERTHAHTYPNCALLADTGVLVTGVPTLRAGVPTLGVLNALLWSVNSDIIRSAGSTLCANPTGIGLSLIHISEPTRPY